MESFLRVAKNIKVLLTSLLKLPPVKNLHSALAVGLFIGRNFSPSQNNNSLMTLPSIYTLRDENYSRINQ